MTTFGDLRYYYQFAELVDRASCRTAISGTSFHRSGSRYSVSLRRHGAAGEVDFTAWATALGLIMTVFDVGNLLLLRQLGRRLHGRGAAPHWRGSMRSWPRR